MSGCRTKQGFQGPKGCEQGFARLHQDWEREIVRGSASYKNDDCPDPSDPAPTILNSSFCPERRILVSRYSIHSVPEHDKYQKLLSSNHPTSRHLRSHRGRNNILTPPDPPKLPAQRLGQIPPISKHGSFHPRTVLLLYLSTHRTHFRHPVST